MSIYDLPSQDDMLRAIGRGMQAFSRIEAGITNCFGGMLGEGAPFHHIILEAARRYEMKLKIVDSVAPYALPDDLLLRWQKISKRCRKRSEVRNKIAHWTVNYLPMPKSQPSPDDPISKVVLSPPYGSTDWILLNFPHLGEYDAKPIKINEIDFWIRSCHEVANDLTDLSIDIRAHRSDKKSP